MCKKLIYLVSFVLVLGLAGTASAELVAYWRFEGDFIDATGNGHDGTPFDAPAIVDDPARRMAVEPLTMQMYYMVSGSVLMVTGTSVAVAFAPTPIPLRRESGIIWPPSRMEMQEQ